MVRVVFYQEADGSCPIKKEFFELLPERALAQARGRIKLLAAYGHELRRPYTDYLDDGIYELRWRTGKVQYRILYFFHGQELVVLAYGLTKEAKIPEADFNRALRRKQLFKVSPKTHTLLGDEPYV